MSESIIIYASWNPGKHRRRYQPIFAGKHVLWIRTERGELGEEMLLDGSGETVLNSIEVGP